MFQKIRENYGWLIGLLVFDFFYYYFIQLITTPNAPGLRVPIRIDGFIFSVLTSGLSLGCVWWVKRRLERKPAGSISAKYLKLFLYSFGLFALLTSGTQFTIESLLGQQRSLEYVIGNGLVITFLHLIVGNVYIALSYVRESTELKQEILRIEKAKAESELKALQQQMSPHFLFNNLNTLASLIPPEGEQAIAFTQRLATVFRYVSHNASKTLVPLREELDFLADYLELLRFRFGPAYRLERRLDGLVPDRYLAVPLALQTVVENVVKHNSGNRTHPLRIILSQDEGYLIIENELRPKQLSSGARSGVGLQNLSDRYRLTTGRDIHYGATDGHFLVRIPLIKQLADADLAD